LLLDWRHHTIGRFKQELRLKSKIRGNQMQ
jgi:hypothetical protein